MHRAKAGTMKIKLGTVNSSIDLKYVVEHELMHLFQYNTETVAGDTVDHAPGGDKFFIEGQATYWGIESTKANYKLNDSQIQKEFERVGDHNWFDHYLDLNRTIFKGWGGEYDDYSSSVQQTIDGGYIFIGTTESYAEHYNNIWIIKTDEYGNEQWYNIFRTKLFGFGDYIQQTTNGGFILIGRSGWDHTNDVWLIKFDGIENLNNIAERSLND